MYEILQAALIGSTVGIICGCVPGVGMFVACAILYPILLDLQPVELLMFYTCMVCSAQYFGSVTAIYLGIAGEASSFPAVVEGYNLSKQGQGQKAIFLTGVGSFIGTTFGLIAIGLMALATISLSLTSLEKSILFAIVGISLIWTTKNKLTLDVFLIILAIGLCHIGYSGNTNIPLTYFDILIFSQGIHFFPLCAGLLSMKEVLSAEDHSQKELLSREKFLRIKSLFAHKWCILRGSLIGSLGGLLPGLTTISASHLSYLAEKRIQNNYKPGNTFCLTSSETANNAGSITQLFPLLMFGIPITGSEAIIYAMLDIKGWENSANEVLGLLSNQWHLLLFVNLIALTLAIKFAKHFVKIVPNNNTLLKIVVFFILCFTTYLVGETTQGQGLFNMVLFWIATFIAWKTPRVNYIPFIFWMVVGHILLDHFYTFLMINEYYAGAN